MIKLQVRYFIYDHKPEDSEYESAEVFCKRIIDDKKRSFNDKIEVLDSVIEISKNVLNNELTPWRKQVSDAKENGALSEISKKLKNHFFKEIWVNGAEQPWIFVCGLGDENMLMVLCENPGIIDEICNDIKSLIDKVSLTQKQMLETEISTSLKEIPNNVPIERIQWLGKTIDFYRLIDYLERKGLIPPKNKARFSRFFLDKKGNPMPEDSSPQTSKADLNPEIETMKLIDSISERSKS